MMIHPVDPQEPTGVTLNKTTLSLEVAATETLIATVEPTNAEDKTVTWTSSDETIATVDANGLVTAIKAGTATITVSTINNIVGNCALTVPEAAAHSANIQPDESWTKDDIKKYLDEKGTEYNASANKTELLNLV